MSYDPFGRGPFPVGVRSTSLHDPTRDRALPTEIWYPAAAAHRGQDRAEATQDEYSILIGLPGVRQEAVRDAAPAAGRFPLVIFSHGYSGHRRQSTFWTTHLASHGYVVAAADHTGNTTKEIIEQTLAAQSGKPVPSLLDNVVSSLSERPDDARFLLAQMVDGAAGPLAEHIDAEQIGMTGHSFGGWTTLTTVHHEPRIRAAVVLAPAGGFAPAAPNPLAETVALAWEREVPTLFLAAALENVLSPESVVDLYERTPDPKRLLLLENADHFHFCDRAAEVHEIFRAMPWPGGGAAMAERIPPFAELVGAEIAYDFTRGLGVAHFDAVLKESQDAGAWLGVDSARALAARGVATRRI
jgi:predicted dienelactone hydrolase